MFIGRRSRDGLGGYFLALNLNISEVGNTFKSSVNVQPQLTSLRTLLPSAAGLDDLLTATMNVSRPARCLFCSYTKTSGARQTVQITRRAFSAATPTQAGNDDSSKKRPASSLIPKIKYQYPSPDEHARYTPEQLEKLKDKYTKAQLAAIEAGENAIPPSDLAGQASLRTDQAALRYLDDLSQIDPSMDKAIRAPYSNSDRKLEMKTTADLQNDLAEWFATNQHQELDGMDFVRWADNLRLTKGGDAAAEYDTRSAEAPEVFEDGEDMEGDAVRERAMAKMYKDKDMKMAQKAGNPDDELAPEMARLCKELDMTVKEINALQVKVLVQRSVVNQTRLGKIRKAWFLAVAGNGQGMLGIGEGKAEEASSAMLQARMRAIRSMQPIRRYENRTIYGDVKGKVGAVELELYNRPPGKLL